MTDTSNMQPLLSPAQIELGKRVRELRDKGMSVFEAKRVAEREQMVLAIHAAGTVEDLKKILLVMIGSGKLM